MRGKTAAVLLAAALIGGCHQKPAGPTTGDGIPVSDLDNRLGNNEVTNTDQPEASPTGG